MVSSLFLCFCFYTFLDYKTEQKISRQHHLIDFSLRFSLCQAYIEHGKFLPLDEELIKEEKAVEKQKAEKAAARLKKETAAAVFAERKRKTRERYN